MKKILIIQTAGEHNGSTHLCKNDHLRECLSLQNAFKNCGWDADVWGRRHLNFNIQPNFNSYDYILNLENYEMEWLPDFSQITKPIKMQWIIDLHFQHPNVYANISKDMDIILHSTKSLIPLYQQIFPNKQHVWFPNGLEDRYFKDYYLEKDLDFTFIGNVVNRGGILNRLISECGLKHFIKTGEEMLNLISRTKVHFNKSISVDVNYRNFETIGLGTCLLTNYLPELEELGFKDGENCIFYYSDDQIKEKLNWVLTEDRWKKIAENGKNFVKNHTYTIRVKNLINYLLPNLSK